MVVNHCSKHQRFNPRCEDCKTANEKAKKSKSQKQKPENSDKRLKRLKESKVLFDEKGNCKLSNKYEKLTVDPLIFQKSIDSILNDCYFLGYKLKQIIALPYGRIIIIILEKFD